MKLKLNTAVFAFVGILVVTGVAAYAGSIDAGYETMLNGETIGYVKEIEAADEALDNIIEDITGMYGEDARYEPNLTYRYQKGIDAFIADEDIEEILESKIQVEDLAYVISSAGEGVAVDTKETAENVLEAYKNHFTDSLKGVEVVSTAFVNEPQIDEIYVPVEDILSDENALNKLVSFYRNEKSVSVKKAEKWELSLAYDLVDDVDEMLLSDGDEVKVYGYSPLLDVKVIAEMKYEETLAFDTVKKEDDSQYKGYTKTTTEGENGSKEITRELVYVNGLLEADAVIGEVVTKVPTDKVVTVGTKQRVVVSRSSNRSPAPTYNGEIGSASVATAKHYLGVPYVRGGSTPSGFDCSGFTKYVYGQYGISIPRTSSGQASFGGYVAREDLRPGDIVAFTGHVGIYIGNGYMIHSPSTGKVVEITSINSAYWRAKYISGRRVY